MPLGKCVFVFLMCRHNAIISKLINRTKEQIGPLISVDLWFDDFWPCFLTLWPLRIAGGKEVKGVSHLLIVASTAPASNTFDTHLFSIFQNVSQRFWFFKLRYLKQIIMKSYKSYFKIY